METQLENTISTSTTTPGTQPPESEIQPNSLQVTATMSQKSDEVISPGDQFRSPTLPPTSVHFEPSRWDPVPFGASVSSGIIDFSIAGLIRPATVMVLEASSANPKPKTGTEYVLVNLVEVCAAPVHIECFIRVQDMKLVGSTGIERRSLNLVDIPFMLPNRHIKGGSTAYGYVAFMVDQNEEELVFYYEAGSDETVYLSTE